MEDPTQIYDKFSKLLVRKNELQYYEYPLPDPSDPSLCIKERGVTGPLDAKFAPSYTCKHCSTSYAVDENGMQIYTDVECVYHSGYWLDQRSIYSCCMRGAKKGCEVNEYHVNEGQTLLSTYQNYVRTLDKPELEPNKHGVFALCSRFCFTTHGLELTQIVVLDPNEKVVYERVVKPDHPILHYGTRFTGLWADYLQGVTTSLAEVQQDLLQTFSSKSILIGHDVGHHMKALKMYHEYFVDTTVLYPRLQPLPIKKDLATLMKDELGMILSDSIPRGAHEDARAVLKLAKRRMEQYYPN